jgi:hypothetical protein
VHSRAQSIPFWGIVFSVGLLMSYLMGRGSVESGICAAAISIVLMIAIVGYVIVNQIAQIGKVDQPTPSDQPSDERPHQ